MTEKLVNYLESEFGWQNKKIEGFSNLHLSTVKVSSGSVARRDLIPALKG
jgi:hypothetical protein